MIGRILARLGRPLATGVVLMWHRIAAPRHDPFALAVPPARFAEQLDAVRRHCRIVPLAELAAARLPRRPLPVAITFDDAYVDTLAAAAPELARRGLPYTVFACPGLAGTGAFWWDVLAEAPAGRRNGIAPVAQGLRRRPAPEALAAAMHLAEGAQPEDGARPLDRDGIVALARQPGCRIGCHAATHRALAGLAADDLHAEIAGAQATLAAWLGAPPDSFAYPYGDAAAIDDAAVAAVRTAGFACAVTTRQAAVAPWDDRMRLPRLAVRDVPAADLLAAIRRSLA